MNKNVSWTLLIFIWSGVILLTFTAYRLVRIQTYDLQQEIMVRQTLQWEEDGIDLIDETSISSTDNKSIAENSSEPIAMTNRSALVEAGDSYFNIFDQHINEQPLDQWMILVLQNHLKINLPLTPETSRDWEWALAGDKIRIQFRSELDARKDILSRKKQGKYSVQLGSFKSDNFTEAISWTRRLIDEGYYSYLHRTEEKFEKKYWYRVRVGFFKNTEDALEEGLKIQQRLRQSIQIEGRIWSVIPDSREMSRELINLKQPRNKPWVIQFPVYPKQNKALEDLALAALMSDFSYLSRKIDGKTLEPEFRIRLGFFETSSEAKKQKYKFARQWSIFKKSHIIRLGKQ
ncbi:MAG: hypothetical protein CL925_16775 [Deltaproteobacteria bacterium]|nr:hypothetical protein [Deltaproteobacteria bacterium]